LALSLLGRALPLFDLMASVEPCYHLYRRLAKFLESETAGFLVNPLLKTGSLWLGYFLRYFLRQQVWALSCKRYTKAIANWLVFCGHG
jgi:hypothetical protein